MKQISPVQAPPEHQAHRNSFVVKRSTLIRGSIVAVILIAAGIIAFINVMLGQARLATAWQSAGPSELATDDDPSIGPRNALVTIVEFSDFRCEYCKVFHDQVQAPLLEKYGNKLRFIYRDFPTSGGHALAAAAGCAYEQNAYWAYHDALFSAPLLYSSENDFVSLASSLSIDQNRFRDCYSSGRYSAEVEQDYQAGIALGVRGTPTFFINGQMLVGTQSPAVFEAIINQHLDNAGG
jgi:protein-disulfide isomerase